MGKCGRCIGLTTLPPPCAVVMKSGNLNFLKPSGPLQTCNGTDLPFYNQHAAPVSQIIYSCKTLYVFRTFFPSITRSSKLHIRQQAYIKQLLLPAASGVASSSCLTYTCCRMCSFELLMMDEKTVRKM